MMCNTHFIIVMNHVTMYSLEMCIAIFKYTPHLLLFLHLFTLVCMFLLHTEDGVQLDANKHNFMVKELARRLSDDEINHRMLYRDFCLTQDQKQKIDDYPQMHYKMYETLAQYIESKQPMLAELIKILNANQVKQEHVKFLYDCKYD